MCALISLFKGLKLAFVGFSSPVRVFLNKVAFLTLRFLVTNAPSKIR